MAETLDRVWTYEAQINDPRRVKLAANARKCIFCEADLATPSKTLEPNYTDPFLGDTYFSGDDLISIGNALRRTVRICPVCGWWVVVENVGESLTVAKGKSTEFGNEVKNNLYGAAGSLRKLDLGDQTVPIAEIRQYLAAKYDDRFEVNCYRFEEVVASVYRDLGYSARVTAKSQDGGIDVILDGPDRSTIGVQVRRYRNRIHVSQLYEIVGVLALRGLTEGIFVTTSDFPSTWSSTVQLAATRGIRVELVDAARFYDALGLAQRVTYESADDPSAPFAGASLFFLDSETVEIPSQWDMDLW
jgi:hypothetical protein